MACTLPLTFPTTFPAATSSDNRRVAGLGVIALGGAARAAGPDNRITLENAKPGDPGWRLARPRVVPPYRSPAIEGFAPTPARRPGKKSTSSSR